MVPDGAEPPGPACAWWEGPVGLGLNPGSDARPSGSPRPRVAHHPDLGLTAVADARIDNRPEVLGALGISWASGSEIDDAELVLRAYRRWGASTPERLLGDFAFAVWDHDRRHLFCARDPFGVRPFYYHLSDRIFAFASGTGPLRSLPGIPQGLDGVQVGFWFDNFVEDRERTFFRRIRRLPGGHQVTVGVDRAEFRRYWTPEPEEGLRYASEDEYAQAFLERLTEAVACRIAEPRPIGSALSGGLDSSSIVCLARRLLPASEPLHTFSAVFRGLPEGEREWIDEAAYVDAVVAGRDVVSHRVRADQIGPLDDYDDVLRHQDGPPLGFNLYMHWALYREAQQAGVNVFLDGVDGDSVVSHGYERFVDLSLAGRWAEVVDEVQALSRRYEGSPEWFARKFVYPNLAHLVASGHWIRALRGVRTLGPAFDRRPLDLLVRYGVRGAVPEGLRSLYRRARDGEEGVGEETLLRRDFTRRTRLRERKRALQSSPPPGASGREIHTRVLPLALIQYAMELVDPAARRFGLEPRYPFLDRRLVEFCLSVPTEQKLGDGWTRLIQRRAMEGILPPEVQWRVRKANLGYNFRRGMRQAEDPWLERVLAGEDPVLEAVVDPDRLRGIHDRFMSGESPRTDDQDAMQLYKVAVLARWLDAERSVAGPPEEGREWISPSGLVVRSNGTPAWSASRAGAGLATPELAAYRRRIGPYRTVKRAVDVVAAGLLLVILAPVLLLIALLVRRDLGSPVLFTQLRPGRDEELFRLYKFRTMREATDENGRPLPDEERITRFGAWLRKSSLDELPELWNVLKGDMSLVGPRPLLQEYLPYYSPRQRLRHAVRPGITGLAQIRGRNMVPWQPRLELDVQYVERLSLRMDLEVLLRTLPFVLSRKGVSEEGRATMTPFHRSEDTR